MPERVKIIFDDSDTDTKKNVSARGRVEQQKGGLAVEVNGKEKKKKRKVDDAFGSRDGGSTQRGFGDDEKVDENKSGTGRTIDTFRNGGYVNNGDSSASKKGSNEGINKVLTNHRKKQQQGSQRNANGSVVTFDDCEQKKRNSRGEGKSARQMIPNGNDEEIQKGGRLKKRAAELLKSRQQLPIWTHADEIRSKVRNHDVLLLVGETGSGKSTQIPQFLLPFCRRVVSSSSSSSSKKGNSSGGGVKVGGCIAITQPRRVAAISLARRVAEEMGTPLGNSSPASQVGYSVRFDNSVGPSTRVKFLTDGMLLQELIRDPWLKEYSVVVVDEVHERGVNVDLVLGFLKRLIEGRNKNDGRGGVGLKVVVMSATADMDKIQQFFGSDKVGILNGVETGAVSNENGSSNGHENNSNNESNGQLDKEKTEQVTLVGESHTRNISNSLSRANTKVAACYIKGRQYPVKTHYTPIPLSDVLDAALERIIDIHTHTPLPGDILVFLPGQETIDTLESMCRNYAQSLTIKSKQKGAPKLPKLLILPLFAALPTASQQRVFDPTPPFTRKIILSTNIAETSVTVPGIRHVIDTGKRKARFFRPGLNLDTLLTKSISRSSANQRAGRAGREAAGNCYRLYTEKSFYELEADTEPEILRCDLSQLVLTLKAHKIDNIMKFPLLTPPPGKALERALLHLLRLKALDRQTGQITGLGRQMSKLPLPANLARVLIASQSPEFDCVEEIIDIVSGLSVENIWLSLHNTVRQRHPTAGDEIGEVMDMSNKNNGNADDNVGNGSISKSRDDNGIHSNPNNGDEEGVDKPYKNENDKYSYANQQNGNDEEDDELDDPIAQARMHLRRREGDHMTLLATIQAYAQENTDRKEWCRRHGVNHRAMTSMMDIRKQLTKLLIRSPNPRKGKEIEQERKSGKDVQDDSKPSQNKNDDEVVTPSTMKSKGIDQDKTTRILKTLLLGLSENIACLSSLSSSSKTTTKTNNNNNNQNQSSSSIWTGPYTTLSSSSTLSSSPSSTQRNLSIHPSSVLFNPSPSSSSTTSGPSTAKPAYIMFSEFVVTNRAYARNVSVVEGDWLFSLDDDDDQEV